MGKTQRKSTDGRDVERRERFLRLAPKRVNAARHALKLVGNCASSYSYLYEPGEADKVLSALHEAVNEVEARFRNVKRDDSFTL